MFQDMTIAGSGPRTYQNAVSTHQVSLQTFGTFPELEAVLADVDALQVSYFLQEEFSVS